MTKSSPLSSSVNRLSSGNIELTLTIPWAKVQKAYEGVVDETVKETEIKGFRKGHVPRKMVEERLDRNQTFSHALQHLLPEVYQAAVDELGLKPVVYPQIKIEEGKEGEDWIFIATLCEAPTTDQVPHILVEQETDRRLATLAENLSRLGITLDKYLTSKKLTAESLKEKLANEVKQDIMSTKHGQLLKKRSSSKPH